ncbi:MAG: WbqC family protein [Candidatus Bathyarchaeota archaeon]|nr:WbqC family protein [Candidatus Bathyarchaeota archaeon]
MATESMIVAGHQPNYLPWLGFFDKLRRCDVFIIEDNVQYEHQGFTNRNRIMTVDGVRWLTVPVEHAKWPIRINEVRIANRAEPKWNSRHWLTLKHGYCKAPHWNDYADFFEETYMQEWTYLIDLNMHVIRGIMHFLGIDTPLVLSSKLGAKGKKSELIIAQCKKIGADTQLAGRGGKVYINDERFRQEGINLIFQEFKHPIYTQAHDGFVSNLSAVDYLFCVGGKPW